MGMRDITDLMNIYRECSRHLWNTYFSGRENSGGSLDAFSQITPLLFEGLIENELNYESEANVDELAPPVLKVVPRERSPIIIKFLNKPGENNCWGEGKDIYVNSEEIELDFVDYFDWSQWPIREFHFYRCRIVRFASHPEFEGREALIEALNGRVFHDESK